MTDVTDVTDVTVTDTDFLWFKLYRDIDGNLFLDELAKYVAFDDDNNCCGYYVSLAEAKQGYLRGDRLKNKIERSVTYRICP